MPGSKLVKLKTDLKSLKYGHDRQGDGNSGQPYITAPIPNRLSTSPFDDGYIRGGRALAAKASKEDSLRISKFFKDKPKGPLFIARQIGLQLTNPKLETRQINLTGFGLLGSLLTAGFNTFNQLLPGPTRLYNDGKNTLTQISGTAFGEHFERHGLSPVQDDNTKYLAVAYNNNKNGNNRLIALKKKLIKPGISNPRSSNVILGTINAILGAVNVFNRIIGRGTNPLLPTSPLLQPPDLIIDRYSGGPNSKYGIGLTTIRRFDVTSNGFNSQPILERVAPGVPTVDYSKDLGVSKDYFTGNFGNDAYLTENNIGNGGRTLTTPSAINYTTSNTVSKYLQLQDIIEKQSNITQRISNGLFQTSFFTTKNHTVVRGAKDFKYNLDNLKNVFNRVDADLMTIVFQAIDPFGDVTSGYRFNFSAYIKGFKDNFDATWNEYNYVGRSESFYTYNKFKRNVSFSFDIPCFNRTQLLEKHRALGQLASTTAGAYNTNGLLGGVLLKVKVGGYLNNEYAILNSISYDIPDDSSWDLDGTGDTSKESIDERNQLAMYLKVNVSLTIIHNKLPEYQVPDVKGNEKAGFFGDLDNPIARGNLPAQ
ncbi:MAG: hypothetical protein K9G65_01965 [Rickettsiaceae bacterium]|nr:hypothetical protein [Rickettsiaceae bacterium]